MTVVKKGVYVEIAAQIVEHFKASNLILLSKPIENEM